MKKSPFAAARQACVATARTRPTPERRRRAAQTAKATEELGAQITGMTIIPEAPLCRDLDMTYASIGIISNYCTGMTGYVTDDDIESVMVSIRQRVFDLCFELIRRSEK